MNRRACGYSLLDLVVIKRVLPIEKELELSGKGVCVFPLTLGKGLNLASEFLLLPIVV